MDGNACALKPVEPVLVVALVSGEHEKQHHQVGTEDNQVGTEAGQLGTEAGWVGTEAGLAGTGAEVNEGIQDLTEDSEKEQCGKQ